MPKITDPNTIILQNGGSKVWEYDGNGKNLFCKLCSHHIDYKRKSLVSQHVQTAKHKKNLDLAAKGRACQQQLLTTVVKRPPFVTDLSKMLVSCNIPLYKVEQPAFIDFMEKYTKTTMPSRTTLTRCMEEESRELLKKIKLR
jgi:hypothetical protein